MTTEQIEQELQMTDDLRFILGMMCTQASPIAHQLVKQGHTIKTRAEDEQAYVIHWMLKAYLLDKTGWLAKCEQHLKYGK